MKSENDFFSLSNVTRFDGQFKEGQPDYLEKPQLQPEMVSTYNTYQKPKILKPYIQGFLLQAAQV